jgi:hypothetical protein
MIRVAPVLGFLFILAPAAAQQVRVFGQADTEADVTPANEAGPLNPGNILNVPLFTDTSDLTVFGDVSADDKRWKLKVKLHASGDWSSQSLYKFDVSELSFRYSVTSWLDLHVGREIEKWGTGYAWNPTGVLNPPKDPTDPNDRRSLYTGVNVAGADIFTKGWDITLLGVPQISWAGKDGRHLLSTGWAARSYRLIKGTDVAFTASGGNGLPNSEGLSLARVFGNSLELHAEAAYISDTIRYLPRWDGLVPDDLVPVRRPHSEILVGGQYTFPNRINVVAEYYHASQGLSDREWNGYEAYAATAQQNLLAGNPQSLMLANAQFTPLNMSKDYTFLRVLWPILPNRLEIETILVTSLRDGSSVVQPTLTKRVGTNWSVYLLYNHFLGGPATEFGNVQIGSSTDIGIRYRFSLEGKTARSK